MTLPHGTPLWWYTRQLFVGVFGNSEMEPSKSDNSSTKVRPSNFRPPTTGWTVWKFEHRCWKIPNPCKEDPHFAKEPVINSTFPYVKLNIDFCDVHFHTTM